MCTPVFLKTTVRRTKVDTRHRMYAVKKKKERKTLSAPTVISEETESY